MFSIKSKIIFAYTLLFGTLLTIFAVIIYISTKQNNISRLDANLNSYSNIVAAEIEEQIDDEHKIDINELKSLPAQGLYKTSIRIFDKAKGDLYVDSLLINDNSFVEDINHVEKRFIQNH